MMKSNILPNAEQFDKLLEYMGVLTDLTVPTDFYGTPGSKRLLAGDTECGFYGFVQPSEFGETFNGNSLALDMGVSAGMAINSNVPWAKFSWKGKILFVALKPIRYGVTWRDLYRAGVVYGDGTAGFSPDNARVGRSISLNSSNQINLGGTPNIGVPVGGIIVTKGFNIPSNNGRWIVESINSNSSIYTVSHQSGTSITMQDESGVDTAVVYNDANVVLQNKRVNIKGNNYAVRLIKGAQNEVVTSTDNASGQSTLVPASIPGNKNEWNNLMLALHVKSKTKTWVTPGNVGTINSFGLDLTDNDLGTGTNIGGFTLCQESASLSGNEAVFSGSSRKLVRGWNNATGDSASAQYRSILDTGNASGWRPVLELIYE